MNEFAEVLSIIGYVIRALGFIVLGFGVGRFTMDASKKLSGRFRSRLQLVSLACSLG